jgi:hypothetical protein
MFRGGYGFSGAYGCLGPLRIMGCGGCLLTLVLGVVVLIGLSLIFPGIGTALGALFLLGLVLSIMDRR